MKFTNFYGPSVVSNLKRIIITVPHALINESGESRYGDELGSVFDNRAKDVANILYPKLQKEFITELFISNSRRTEADLNRRETLGTKWRQDINYKILNYINDGLQVILFDIHSFSETVVKEWKGKPVVLISDDILLWKKIIEVRKDSLRVPVLKMDDIISTAKNIGAISNLIEFNESEDVINTSDIEKVCDKIVEFTREV